MKLLVCGGRDFKDRESLFYVLNCAHAQRLIDELIHGASRGADALAGEWARSKGILETPVPADWNRLGKRAWRERNERMLAMKPDGVVAFPGGRGTAHMIEISEAAGIGVLKPLFLWNFLGTPNLPRL